MTVYWEDLEVGFETEGGRFRFSEEDIVRFAREFDPRPSHTDPDAARRTLFDGLAASGIHTMGAWSRLWWDLTSDYADQAGAEMHRLRMLRPVRPGDMLSLWFRIDDKRPHPLDLRFGFFDSEQRLFNQDRQEVFRVRCRIMIARRPKGA